MNISHHNITTTENEKMNNNYLIFLYIFSCLMFCVIILWAYKMKKKVLSVHPPPTEYEI